MIKFGNNYMTQVTTDQQYDSVIKGCKEIFIKKTKDYGTSWRVYRPISIADQLYIKAKRIRNIQETGVQKVDDDVYSEFKGIINYAIIGLIQLDIHDEEVEEIPVDEVSALYDAEAALTKKLMEDKNHDYGEAWREMSHESFVDLILAKVLRIKQIIRNDGKTLVSEGIDANYGDIINYAVFALILSQDGRN
jgi:Nucleotide modification associated domain 1